MSCPYFYAEGFRFRFGCATVTVDGKVLRITDPNEGRSHLDRFNGHTQPDGAVGTISLKDLETQFGSESLTITVRGGDSSEPIILTLVPSKSRGRSGRVSDVAELAKSLEMLSSGQRRALARLQVESIPKQFQGSSRSAASARLRVLLDEIVRDDEPLGALDMLLAHPQAPRVFPLGALDAGQREQVTRAADRLPPGRNRRLFRSWNSFEVLFKAQTSAANSRANESGQLPPTVHEHETLNVLAARGVTFPVTLDVFPMSLQNRILGMPNAFADDEEMRSRMIDLQRTSGKPDEFGAVSQAVALGRVSILDLTAAGRDANDFPERIRPIIEKHLEVSPGPFPVVVTTDREVVAALSDVTPLLGVEFTAHDVPGLDHNIDPQHGTIPGFDSSSAIEAACSAEFNYPGRPDVVPMGAAVVTSRADLDAYGAVALLRLRAQSKGSPIDLQEMGLSDDEYLEALLAAGHALPEIEHRLESVGLDPRLVDGVKDPKALAERARQRVAAHLRDGGETGRRSPLIMPESLEDEITDLARQKVSDAELVRRVQRIAAADVRADLQRRHWEPGTYDPDKIDEPELLVLSIASTGRDVDPNAGVEMVKQWLLDGSLPADGSQVLDRVRRERRQAYEDVTTRGGVTVERGVARVVSTHHSAIEIAYTRAPLVVASNPEFLPRGADQPVLKHTVALHPSVNNDLRQGLVEELNRLEEARGGTPGWGGQAKIIGSPQGVSSKITSEELAGVVAKWSAS